MSGSSVKISSPPETWLNVIGIDATMSFDLTSGCSSSPDESLFPRSVQVCGTATTVIWNDGTVTIVKLMDGAIYSEEDAIVFAYFKRMTGNGEDNEGNKRNWMKAALETVTVIPSKEERKANRKFAQAEKQAHLESLDAETLTAKETQWLKARQVELSKKKEALEALKLKKA